MASYKNGINGDFSGKVGTVVGATWNGVPYMRSLPRKRLSAAKGREKMNHTKFAMAHHWLKPITDVVRVGFKGYTPTVQGFIAAKSYLLKNAFEDEGELMRINPALMKISHGNLSLSNNASAIQTAANEITFTWDTGSVPEGCDYDQAMLLAYDVENKIAEYKITGQFRNVGKDSIQVHTHLPQQTFHLYLAFLADDRSRQSDSVYLGEVRV